MRIRNSSLIKLQIATLYSQRFGFAIAGFCDFILILAMDFAGWLDTPTSMIHAVWIQMGLCTCVCVCLFLSGENRRSEYFRAQKRLKSYLWAEWIVLVIVCGLFNLGWCLWMGMTALSWTQSGIIYAVMMVVSMVSGHAMICNLMPRIVHLSHAKRMAVMLLTSGPWMIPAWLLGILASESVVQGNPFYYPVLGLIALGLIQVSLGTLYRESK